MVGDRAVDQRSQQILVEVVDVGDSVENGFVGPFPHERVCDHHGQSKGGRPPIRREVDHRGWKAVIEQHVAGQVSVNQLIRSRNSTECRGQPSEVLDIAELAPGQLTSSNPISDCPRVSTALDEPGPGNVDQGRMESVADGDDLWPTPFLMASLNRLPGTPAIDDE